MRLQAIRTFADFLVDGASELLWLESRYIDNMVSLVACFSMSLNPHI